MTPAAYYALCQAEREEVLDQMLPRQLLAFTEQMEDADAKYGTVHGRRLRPLLTRLRELASGLLDRIEGPVKCADPCNSSCECVPCEVAREDRPQEFAWKTSREYADAFKAKEKPSEA